MKKLIAIATTLCLLAASCSKDIPAPKPTPEEVIAAPATLTDTARITNN